ncbi:MAG: hypothetical protein ABIN97_01020 [Ginsengibacter sp.]
MNPFFSSHISKEKVFFEIREELNKQELPIIYNEERPWGGFFVIDEKCADNFLETYFSSLNKNEIMAENKLSPKILIVEAGKRLSWQYHYRRAELWKVISGNVGVIRSYNDEENRIEKFNTGDLIKLKKSERHRLVGLDNWGVIAEIWQHTDEDNPSDEEDIVRLNDDFGRN